MSLPILEASFLSLEMNVLRRFDETSLKDYNTFT